MPNVVVLSFGVLVLEFGWVVVAWGRESYFGPAEILSLCP